MDALPFDPFDFVGGMIAISLIVPLVTTVLVIGVIVWAVRRAAPVRDNPAVAELKSRLARGEIDPVQFQVRMRALRDGED